MASSEAAGTVVSVCVMVLLLNSATGTTCDNLHSNLLENLSCEAIDQESDVTKPSVILRWEWPTLTGNHSETGFSIEVVYYDEAGMTQNTITISNATRSDKNTTVPLDRDDEYSFSVYIVCDNASRPATPATSCKVNTYSRRTIGRLSLSCPSTASSSGEARILVSWLSPYGVGVRMVDSWSKCLYNGNTSSQNGLLSGTSLLNFTAPPGTVCLFGANYLLDDYRTKRVPPESCGVPAVQPTGRAQLRVSCSESMAAVDVVTPEEGDTVNSSQLQGWCITPDWVPYPPLESAQRYLEPGQSSIGDLPDGTICSFYGNYTLQSSDVEYTFEPAQCIVNQPIPSPETSPSMPRSSPAPPTSDTSDDSPTANSSPPMTLASTPPVTTAPPTASTLPRTTAPSTASTPPTNDASATKTQTEAPASGFNLGSPVITAVVVAVTLVTTGLVCMIAACLIVKKSSLRTRREQKMQMWLDKTEGPEDIDEDPCVLPQFPYTSHVLDTMSITTEVDYLYKEEGRAVVNKDSLSSLMKAMENDEKIVDSPKLIMDRFLNGFHERAWECSHESLTAPHELSSIQLTEPYEHMNLNTTHSASTNKDFHLDLPPRGHCTNDRSTIERDIANCVRHTDSQSGCYVPSKDRYTDDEGYIHFNHETTV